MDISGQTTQWAAAAAAAAASAAAAVDSNSSSISAIPPPSSSSSSSSSSSPDPHAITNTRSNSSQSPAAGSPAHPTASSPAAPAEKVNINFETLQRLHQSNTISKNPLEPVLAGGSSSSSSSSSNAAACLLNTKLDTEDPPPSYQTLHRGGTPAAQHDLSKRTLFADESSGGTPTEAIVGNAIARATGRIPNNGSVGGYTDVASAGQTVAARSADGPEFGGQPQEHQDAGRGAGRGTNWPPAAEERNQFLPETDEYKRPLEKKKRGKWFWPLVAIACAVVAIVAIAVAVGVVLSSKKHTDSSSAAISPSIVSVYSTSVTPPTTTGTQPTATSFPASPSGDLQMVELNIINGVRPSTPLTIYWSDFKGLEEVYGILSGLSQVETFTTYQGHVWIARVGSQNKTGVVRDSYVAGNLPVQTWTIV
ncbi:hypothetical protein DFJ73DRAFT_762746 [Zopfochytrium polystomum]|nr:hypothetical protein DFJ73DRAFT_762746 [Zopfochytrium polystomum]